MARAGECVENEKIFDISMVKPKESLLSEDENEIPIDASTEEKRDEQRYSVMDEDNDDNTGLVEVKYGGKDETSMVKENKGWSSKKDATEEKHEQFSNVSKVPEAVTSSEYTEKITCIEEERAIQDIKVNSKKVDREDTRDSEERVTASGEVRKEYNPFLSENFLFFTIAKLIIYNYSFFLFSELLFLPDHKTD